MIPTYFTVLLLIVSLMTPSVNVKQPKIAVVTAYTCGKESTGKTRKDKGYCVTASGKKLSEQDSYKVVAADPKYYHFGQKLYLDEIGEVVVEDTGSAIKGENRFDLFISNLEEAIRFGKRKIKFMGG